MLVGHCGTCRTIYDTVDAFVQHSRDCDGDRLARRETDLYIAELKRWAAMRRWPNHGERASIR